MITHVYKLNASLDSFLNSMECSTMGCQIIDYTAYHESVCQSLLLSSVYFSNAFHILLRDLPLFENTLVLCIVFSATLHYLNNLLFRLVYCKQSFSKANYFKCISVIWGHRRHLHKICIYILYNSFRWQIGLVSRIHYLMCVIHQITNYNFVKKVIGFVSVVA